MLFNTPGGGSLPGPIAAIMAMMVEAVKDRYVDGVRIVHPATYKASQDEEAGLFEPIERRAIVLLCHESKRGSVENSLVSFCGHLRSTGHEDDVDRVLQGYGEDIRELVKFLSDENRRNPFYAKLASLNDLTLAKIKAEANFGRRA